MTTTSGVTATVQVIEEISSATTTVIVENQSFIESIISWFSSLF